MDTALRLAPLLSLVLLAVPATASAQLARGLTDPTSDARVDARRREAVELELDAELRSIQGRARDATGLYIVSAVHFFGGALAIVGAGALIDANCHSGFSSGDYDYGPSTEDACGSGLALGLVGGLMVLSSVFTFPLAIGLDVGSGSRRRMHELRRSTRARSEFTFAPSTEGVMVALRGSF